MLEDHNYKLAILGLGYVGLPLAVEFAKHFDVIGFDLNENRLRELRNGIDRTLEIMDVNNLKNTKLSYTSDKRKLREANVLIATVPTPIDEYKNPNLNLLKQVSKIIGESLVPGDVVIFESTVYPGATEEICVPILEKFSELIYNKDFFVGYSPERINPGDKKRKLTEIVKVTSGSDTETANLVDELYRKIITVGTHKASSIKVAEAAKVIENIQRDINIALINELAMLFGELNINTTEVLEAAKTKWNFLDFKPGLVGGHCIGVDPYYLTHKAKEVSFSPEIILAGRKTNDYMPHFLSNKLIRHLVSRNLLLESRKVLVLGVTFKEDCPDIRNSKVIDLVNDLTNLNLDVTVFDPIADPAEVWEEYNLKITTEKPNTKFVAVVLAVAHDQFRQVSIEQTRKYLTPNGVVFDLKGVFQPDEVDIVL